jgi:hypothetical protein
MKKITICFIAMSVLFISTLSMAAEKVEINDALKKGYISVTIFGRANGEMAELRIKRITEASIIILIKTGRTDIAGEVSVLSKSDAEINLTSKYEDAIVLKQTGAARVTRGPVTVDMNSTK